MLYQVAQTNLAFSPLVQGGLLSSVWEPLFYNNTNAFEKHRKLYASAYGECCKLFASADPVGGGKGSLLMLVSWWKWAIQIGGERVEADGGKLGVY